MTKKPENERTLLGDSLPETISCRENATSRPSASDQMIHLLQVSQSQLALIGASSEHFAKPIPWCENMLRAGGAVGVDLHLLKAEVTLVFTAKLLDLMQRYETLPLHMEGSICLPKGKNGGCMRREDGGAGIYINAIYYGNFHSVIHADWENIRSRESVRISTKNLGLSTFVHEFAHALIHLSCPATESHRDFVARLKRIRQKYMDSVRDIFKTMLIIIETATTTDNSILIVGRIQSGTLLRFFLNVRPSFDSESRLKADNLLDEFDKMFLGFYASRSLAEFLSEAFTMFELCDDPSPYALMVGQLVTEFFGKATTSTDQHLIHK